MLQRLDAAASALTQAEANAVRELARVIGSAIRAAASPGDPGQAFASAFLDDVFKQIDTGTSAGTSVTQTAFDDNGNLNPGIVDPNTSPEQQYAQLNAALQRQGVPVAEAQALALTQMVSAGADARTVRGYFVPDEQHDSALAEALAARTASSNVPQPPSEGDQDDLVEPINSAASEFGEPIQLERVVIVGKRNSFQDDLAQRVGGTLGQLFQEGKALAAQGLELAAQGLSLLDIPPLKDFQGRVRDYLDAKAEAGGLSEAETILFATLYAANEVLMPTNVLDFAGSIGKGMTAAVGVIKLGRGVDELAQVVRAESKVAADELRLARGATQPRNGHLSGSQHPTTNIPFTATGHPDFSSVMKAEVKITPTGNRAGDFRAANEAAGFKSTPEGYTWHHHQDETTMQLVPRDIHAQTGHTGGFQPKPRPKP